MKKVKRKISVVLCVLMLFSIFSIMGFAETSSAYYGDINKDGNVTSSDARKILRVSAMLETLSDDEFKSADINKDGKITSSDARKTLRVAAMLDPLVKVENSDIPGTETNIIENISTFIPFDEFAEKHELEDISVFKNLTNNIIIADERTERKPLNIEASFITEGENKGFYNVEIIDEAKDKTYNILSDNKYVIVFNISDIGAVAMKYLSYTNADDFIPDEDDENVELLGLWIDFDSDITFPERESVFVTEENKQKVTTFKKYEPTEEAKNDYPNSDFYLNDAQNILIIDERTVKTPIEISCEIGLDKWDEKELVFKLVAKSETGGRKISHEFEVGEKDFCTVSFQDYGVGSMATTFGFAEDYVKIS